MYPPRSDLSSKNGNTKGPILKFEGLLKLNEQLRVSAAASK